VKIYKTHTHSTQGHSLSGHLSIIYNLDIC